MQKLVCFVFFQERFLLFIFVKCRTRRNSSQVWQTRSNFSHLWQIRLTFTFERISRVKNSNVSVTRKIRTNSSRVTNTCKFFTRLMTFKIGRAHTKMWRIRANNSQRVKNTKRKGSTKLSNQYLRLVHLYIINVCAIHNGAVFYTIVPRDRHQFQNGKNCI